MCGLIGVFNKYSSGFFSEQLDVFKHLLLVDSLRGDDSTGVMLIHNNGDLTLAKEATPAGQYMQNTEFDKLMRMSAHDGSALIAHNRKATKGQITDENAHPFVVNDKIALVHNGTMFGDHKKHADVEVDSHAIAHLIEKHKEPEIALGKFSAAYALMWYDVEAEVVNIIRNKDRPLWFMETENAWYWCSERIFLDFAARRVGIKVKQDPMILNEDSLNQYTLQNRKWNPSWRKVNIKQDFGNISGNVSGDKPTNPQSAFYPTGDQLKPWQEYLPGANDPKGVEDCEPPTGREKSAVLDQSFTYTVGGQSWEKTSHFEGSLAQGTNRKVSAGEFNTEIVGSYLYGKRVRATAFEYVDDGSGGWYLYAAPVDDPNVMIRHHFSNTAKVTEERIMTMALNEWLFEFTIDKKAWSPFIKMAQEHPTNEGYCVLLSHSVKLLKGGGVEAGEKIASPA